MKPSIPALMLLSALVATPLYAKDCADLEFSDAWIREPPPGAKVAAAYFTVQNHGVEAIELTGVASACCRNAMLHESVHTGDRVSMRHLDAVAIDAGDALSFEPGAKHIMLFGPVDPLTAGGTVTLDLSCGDGPAASVDFHVRPPAH